MSERELRSANVTLLTSETSLGAQDNASLAHYECRLMAVCGAEPFVSPACSANATVLDAQRVWRLCDNPTHG